MNTNPTGSTLRDEGHASVLSNNQEWAEAFYALAGNLLASRGRYTTDEVTSIVGLPQGRNAVGAAALAFARRHGLSIVDYVVTVRASRRTGRIAVWGRTKNN